MCEEACQTMAFKEVICQGIDEVTANTHWDGGPWWWGVEILSAIRARRRPLQLFNFAVSGIGFSWASTPHSAPRAILRQHISITELRISKARAPGS